MWVGEVCRNDSQEKDERKQPCVSYTGAFEFGEAAADGAAFRASGLV
jgi:hypothetical protein